MLFGVNFLGIIYYYYVLLLGGSYGTIASDRKSYTEKEYDYAVERGKKIIRMVQDNSAVIQKEDEKKIKYFEFRKKQKKNLLIFGIIKMN